MIRLVVKHQGLCKWLAGHLYAFRCEAWSSACVLSLKIGTNRSKDATEMRISDCVAMLYISVQKPSRESALHFPNMGLTVYRTARSETELGGIRKTTVFNHPFIFSR